MIILGERGEERERGEKGNGGGEASRIQDSEDSLVGTCPGLVLRRVRSGDVGRGSDADAVNGTVAGPGGGIVHDETIVALWSI